jgi:hypothetical protein
MPAHGTPAPREKAAADLMFLTGDRDTATRLVTAAADHAVRRRLPHQLQRLVRIASRHHDLELVEHAQAGVNQVCAYRVLASRPSPAAAAMAPAG